MPLLRLRGSRRTIPLRLRGEQTHYPSPCLRGEVRRGEKPSRSSISNKHDMTANHPTKPILIAHVVYHLGVGGLENGLVNLINRLPESEFRHLIVTLTDYTDFAQRIQRDDVEIVALHKRPGHDWRMFRDLYRLFRNRRPDIVHSRNLAALEAQIPAWLAGVPCRIHGEHGRDLSDKDGTNRKYILQRRLIRPLIHRYIPLSADLERYLAEKIHVPEGRMTRIINGVDTGRFHPATHTDRSGLPDGFAGEDSLVIGTVGRLDPVKGQATLVRAFAELIRQDPQQAGRLRLVIVGDGSTRKELQRLAEEANLDERVWFAGSRDDIPQLMQAMDVFVLPSLAEGISNTIMEAMASGLPVVATDVGGNGELVIAGETGQLVPRDDPQAMARALSRYLERPDWVKEQGRASRRRAEQAFSLTAMVGRYREVYQQASVRRREK